MLFLFEFKKLWKNPFFKGLVCCLGAFNLFALWYLNCNSIGPSLSSYSSLNETLSTLNQEERLEYITDYYEALYNLNVVEQIQHLNSFSQNEFSSPMIQQLETDNPGVYEKYLPLFLEGDFLRYTDNINDELMLISDIYEEFLALNNYERYRQDIINHAQIYSGISIFETSDFSATNIAKTISDYEGMIGTLITLDLSKGIELMTQTVVTDLIGIFLALFMATKIFFEEKQKNVLGLIKATPKGRLTTGLTKTGVLLASIGIITLLLYGTHFLYVYWTVGLGDLSRSIQSVGLFMSSTLPITIRHFLGYFILSKGITLVIIALTSSLLAIFMKQAALIYLISSIFFMGNYGLYLWISSTSDYNAFKYLNIFGFLRPDYFLGTYLNLNLFNRPISIYEATGVTLIASFVFLTIAVVISFCCTKKIQIKNLTWKWIKPFKLKPCSSILGYEAYKLLLVNKSLFLVLAFLGFTIYQGINTRLYISPQESSYRNYMNHLEGELTPEKVHFLETEQLRFEMLRQRIEEIDQQVEEGELLLEEGNLLKVSYQQQLQLEEVFNKVWHHYEHLLKHPQAHFVYDTTYTQLFDATGNQGINSVLTLTFVSILCFYTTFAMEFKGGMIKVLSTTPLGLQKTVRTKVLLAFLMTFVIFLIVEIPQFVIIYKHFGFSSLFAPAQSLIFLARIPVQVSILGYLIFFQCLKFLTTFAITLGVLFISLTAKQPFLALLNSILFLLLTPILSFLGISIFNWFSLIPIFQLNKLLAESLGIFMLYFLLMTTTSIIIYQRFKKTFIAKF